MANFQIVDSKLPSIGGPAPGGFVVLVGIDNGDGTFGLTVKNSVDGGYLSNPAAITPGSPIRSGGLVSTFGLSSDGVGLITVSPAYLFVESFTDGITAFNGGGQASATQLVSEVNRITSATNIGDSVKLPPATPGLSILVTNHATKAIQVFGTGTDQINDSAAATGVSQMPFSECIYVCHLLGKWYVNGLGTGYSGSLETMSFTDAIAAVNPGAQATATPLTTMLNRITTVPANASGVGLPLAAPGMNIVVVNAHASNTVQVFAAIGASDTIDGVAAGTGVTLPATKTWTFYSTVAGAWHSLRSS